MTTPETPLQAGFTMPAEWAPHARTWMMWPCRAEVWADMDATRRNYADVAHAIREFEPVTMLVRPEDEAGARALLGSDIDLLPHPIDDSWARDAGPCFLTDATGQRAGTSFRFNAWGGKYAPYVGDDSASDAILAAAGVRAFTSQLIAEGGGITTDGEGTIITTRSCFPNANRNPGWTLEQIETELKEMLGAEKVIWLPGNTEETETDGHVDGIAMFLAPGLLMVQGNDRPDHHWRHIHAANLAALDGQTDARGRPLKLVHCPDAFDYDTDSDNFCDSYVNAYICNGAVIVPRYNLPEDGLVRELFEEHLPNHDVRMVDITTLATGGGGIHCITQQEPATPRNL